MNNSQFLIYLGLGSDLKTLIVRDMKSAMHKFELMMDQAIAERIADSGKILPAVIYNTPVSITISRKVDKLVYSAQVAEKLSSDKNVFDRKEITIRLAHFSDVKDLKVVNCDHRISSSYEEGVRKRVEERKVAEQKTRDLQEKRDAASELKHCRIPGINTGLIAARLSQR